MFKDWLSSYQITWPLTMKLAKNLKGQVEVLLIMRDYGVGEERGFLPDKHF